MAKLPYTFCYKVIPHKNKIEMIRCEAIPVEWIEEWIDKNVPDGWEEGCAILMLEDWRKENEQSDISIR